MLTSGRIPTEVRVMHRNRVFESGCHWKTFFFFFLVRWGFVFEMYFNWRMSGNSSFQGDKNYYFKIQGLSEGIMSCPQSTERREKYSRTGFSFVEQPALNKIEEACIRSGIRMTPPKIEENILFIIYSNETQMTLKLTPRTCTHAHMPTDSIFM